MSSPKEIIAKAVKEATDGFQAPVRLYVEGEAAYRYSHDEHSEPIEDRDPYYDHPERDWSAESWEIIALAILSALEREGKRIMDREPTKEMIEAGLTATAIWHDLPGSQLQVNRQKMAIRFRACWDTAPSWAKQDEVGE